MVFRKISEFIERISGADSMDTEMSFPALLMSLVTLPFRFLFHFVGFMITYWAASRSLPAFIKGLPAMLFAGGFISSLIVASFLLETRLMGNYEGRYVLEMTKNDDPVMAGEYAQKLMGLVPDEDRYRYHLGLARFQAGDVIGAMDVMHYIATEGDNPLAQVWLAKTVARDQSIDLTVEERTEKSIGYYTSAIQNLDQKENIQAYTEAHLGLALAYENESIVAPTEAARQISLNKAIEKLKTILSGDIVFFGQLEAIPRLIRYYQETGQISEAKEQLRRSMKAVGPIARRFPENLDIWRVMVSSCAMVDDFDYAESIIQEGFQLAPNRQTRAQISRLHSKVLLKKADYIKDMSKEGSFKLRLAVVAQAVMADPQSAQGFEQLMQFVVPEDETEQQELWLRQSVIGSRTPAMPHILLGLRALNRGEILEGQRHWQIASQHSNQAYQIINSMIGYSHTKMPERFNNLNDIVSVAIESFPSQFVFYITRGRMYLDENKYQQAVDDLEVAARKLPNVILLRQSLAKAYEGLGNSAKAEENQAEADRMQAELESRRMELIEGKK